MKLALHRTFVLRLFWCGLLLCSVALQGFAQLYSVKNGKMYIRMDRGTRESALDSFITQFQLSELGLKRFIRKNDADSLLRQGWRIELNNSEAVVISKQLRAAENIIRPADKILFTEKEHLAERFPATNNGILFGYNRFRNKQAFAVNDSVVTFFLRGHLKASRVMLAGSFNNWVPDNLPMTRTDSGWIARIKLGPGKYWYKFIADGGWMVDSDNQLSENDGLGNVNSVFYRPNYVFVLNGFNDARSVYVAGSFNNWKNRDLPMKKTERGWELPLYLAEGTHSYKFIIDGSWYQDARNPEHLPDGTGGFNSVVRIGKPHVFRLNAFENAKQVMLSGSFNNWKEDELAMHKTSSGWELSYVLGPGNYEYRFIADGKKLADPAHPPVHANGNTSFLVIAPNYTFRLRGFENAQTVYLAGDFNDWQPDALPMTREGREWVYSVHLSAGKHLYKFIVDGRWIIDPSNKLWEQNEYDTGNSVLWIGN